MARKVTVKIIDIVGSPIWVASDDGQKVHDKIVAAFEANRSVKLSFSGRRNLITAFLNAAVGQLYGTYEEKFLKENLTFSDISAEDRAMLDVTIQNAQKYFANQAAYNASWKQNVELEDENKE